MPVQRGDATAVDASVPATSRANDQGTGGEIVVAIRKPPTQIRANKPRAVTVPGNYWDMVADYERHLRATNHADNTMRVYSAALGEFANYLTRERISLRIEAVQRAHMEAFIRYVLEERGVKATTVKLWYASLRAFFNWLAAEGEIDSSPMQRMRAPKTDRAPHTILTDERIERLLRACSGRGFYNRRDAAMIRVLLDTGVRRSGLASMRLDQLDLDGGLAQVTSKRHTWLISLGPRTVDALAAYLRVRRQHPHAGRPELWLTKQGALTVRAINGIIDRRCVAAQIPRINPHAFRHTFAHTWLADGGQEGDLAELGGWRSTEMIHTIYGKDLAQARALAAHKRAGLGDRI